jgi:hypothetical protein
MFFLYGSLSLIPDAPRIAEFLLARKKLLAQLTLPVIFEKQQATADDEKIYSILTKRGKIGEVVAAISEPLNGILFYILVQCRSINIKLDKTETEIDYDDDDDPQTETLDSEPMLLDEVTLRRDTSLESLKKTYGKMQRCPSSDISWGGMFSSLYLSHFITR